MTTQQQTGPWMFIGAGNMGGAIAAGALSGGAVSTAQMAALKPSDGAEASFGHVFDAVGDAAAWLDAEPDAGVVLGFKPQMFKDIAAEWRPVFDAGPSRLVVSILAGTTAATVASGLGEHARVVRVMPNTPIRLGMGMSAVSAGPRAGEPDLVRAERLFGASGKTIRINEGLMDAFTGLAGSGPAYVFYLAEGMLEAAEQLGFDREQALMIVRQTVAGSGALLADSPETPRALRTRVTSKGGTTAAGTGVLDDAGVRDAVVRAVHAARHRGAELAKE
jgi:pyrroline-5-carboxylate reductase